MKKILLFIKHIINIVSFSIRDGVEFVKITEMGGVNDKITRRQFELTVGIHSLEKGLSYKTKKKRFGESKVVKQLRTLLDYLRNGYPQKCYAVLETIAVVKEYLRYKDSIGENNAEIKALFGECKSLLHDVSDNYCSAGVEVVKKDTFMIKDQETIGTLFKNTRSIRNFNKAEKVTEQEILSAIEFAKTAPSACNRQPSKVYYTMDENKNKEISKLVPGNRGFEDEIPNFLVVTSAKNYFGLFEYNQWYVNGGIFLGYLRLALRAVGLGHCIFQWSLQADEKALRNLCNIPQGEAIIAIVGIGHYADVSSCIKAQRKSTSEYIYKF